MCCKALLNPNIGLSFVQILSLDVFSVEPARFACTAFGC